MIRIFPGTEEFFRERAAREEASSLEVRTRVAAIVERVRREGDRALLDLSRELDMRSVAEGVETAASLAVVRAAGYNEAQGFYFSPPVRASAVRRAVKQCTQRLAAAESSPEAKAAASTPRRGAGAD